MFNQTCHYLEMEWPRNGCLQNAQYAKCCSSISANPRDSAQWAIVQSGGGSNSRGLVLFPLPPRQVFHSPSDLVPAKRRSASIALLNFHPSSWMISPVVSLVKHGGVGVFSFFSPSDIVCLLRRLIWKESSQSVIERWVKWSTAERFLGSFAWWGEVGHRCPFLHRQADALRTRDAFLSISPSNQCNLCLVICCTVVPAGEKQSEKETQQKKAREWEKGSWENQDVYKTMEIPLLKLSFFCINWSLTAQCRKLHCSQSYSTSIWPYGAASRPKQTLKEN